MTLTSKSKLLLGICSYVLLGIAVASWAVQPAVPDFSKYEAGAERKQVFLNYFLPLIEDRNNALLDTRRQVLYWNQDRENLSWWNRLRIESLAEEYRINEFEFENDEHWATLLRRVDAVPASLALAQAANESGWGTSRFGREGYNYYGQWCYQPGCGIVPGGRDTGKDHEVAVFDSPEESVERYIHNLNSNKAYRSLREIRASLRDADKPITGIELAAGLGSYSQRGNDYIKDLRSLIRRNDLLQHDLE